MNIILKIVMICTICVAVTMSGCIKSETSEIRTKQVAYQVQESYVIQTPYQSPITKMIKHRDPVYETLYTITLIDGCVSGDERYTYTNVYDSKSTYTGNDFWGNDEYSWTLYYYESIPNGAKRYATFYEIDEHHYSSYQGIVDYNEWSEEVISGYETKYRDETKYRTVTKYKTVEY